MFTVKFFRELWIRRYLLTKTRNLCCSNIGQHSDSVGTVPSHLTTLAKKL